MPARIALPVAGMVAALALGVAANAASANKLSVSNRSFRAVWLAIEAGPIDGIVTCRLTVEGSFHSATMSKVVGALVGHVTRATAGAGDCTGGTATVNREALPWHVRYRGFEEALP